MFADPLALRLEPATRPPAIDVLYPEAAPSISTGSWTQPSPPPTLEMAIASRRSESGI